MRQPVIGITPALDEGIKLPQSESTHYLRRTYTEVLASVGAIPLILNIDMPIDSIMSLVDGIVISGGEDIDPKFYSEVPLEVSGTMREPNSRTEWDKQLIAACDEVGIPILGICYGMQLLNVHYGGTLYQDIPTELPEAIEHRLSMHEIRFETDYLGYTSGEVREVASRHHQAVDHIAEGFEVAALAPDGIVEAIRGERHFGMQWHPESDLTGIHVYRAFVEQCMGLPSLNQSTDAVFETAL